MEMSPEEIRVLGCLLEKERTTPDDYPLSRNALVRACNQSTSRHPVVAYDESTVDRALTGLKESGLVRFVHQTHGRGVTRYRQVVGDRWDLAPDGLAVLCVLAVRGPQTPGELKTRTERLHTFASPEEVGTVLAALAAREEPLVVLLDRQPGQKEARWAHLLGGPPDPAAFEGAGEPGRFAAEPSSAGGGPSLAAEVSELRVAHDELAAEVAELRARLEELIGPV